MYELGVTRKFSAAHQLRGYHGKCERMHGHTYQVEVVVKTDRLDPIGLAIDFKDLKRLIETILETYDHRLLNEVPPFDHVNPTAENMAQVIHGLLAADLPPGVALVLVKVWESEDCWASYSI